MAGVEIAEADDIRLALLIPAEAVQIAQHRPLQVVEALPALRTAHRSQHQRPAEQITAAPRRLELVERMPFLEMPEFVAKHRAQLRLGAYPQQQPRLHPHRAVGRHAGVERRHPHDIDPCRAAAILAHRRAQHRPDITGERLVMDDERRSGELRLALVILVPDTDLVHTLRLVGAGVRRGQRRWVRPCGRGHRGNGGEGQRESGRRQPALHHGFAGWAASLPGKSSSSCPIRLIAPSASRTSPPIAASALSHSRSPVRRSTNPA